MFERSAPAFTTTPVTMYPLAEADVPQELVAVTVAACVPPAVMPVKAELVVAALTSRQVESKQTR